MKVARRATVFSSLPGWCPLEDASQAVPDCAGTTTTGLGERHRTGQAWEVKNEDSNA